MLIEFLAQSIFNTTSVYEDSELKGFRSVVDIKVLSNIFSAESGVCNNKKDAEREGARKILQLIAPVYFENIKEYEYDFGIWSLRFRRFIDKEN